MFDKPFNLDRVVRLILLIGSVLAAYFLIDKLSFVLLPFLLAWLTAYMLNPIVKRFQGMLKHRLLSVVSTLLLLIFISSILLLILIPMVLGEIKHMQELIHGQLGNMNWPAWIPRDLVQQLNSALAHIDIASILSQNGLIEQSFGAISNSWSVVKKVFGLFSAVFSIFTYVLYVLFIMLDYDNVFTNWLKLVPIKYRAFIERLSDDIEEGMNGYFKAQSKVVFTMMLLFAVGFKVIGLPFAIVLGIVIGLLNYIPYAQLFGLIPAAVFAGLHALETDSNFWFMLLMVLLTFTIIQVIQDLILVPKFMGDFSGFNPAIILLSLSIWGSLLGITGLIIAIPLTSVLLAYYKRYILKPQKEAFENEQKLD